MRIIKHYNSYKNKWSYKCTIRNTTQYGTLEQVTKWRDDQMQNEDYYLKLEELSNKGKMSFYKNNHSNWCGD